MCEHQRGVYVCLGISCIITVGLSTILYLTGGYIYLLFTTDAAVIAIGMKILHFLVPAFVTYLWIEIYSGALRGVGDCWIPMIMTALSIASCELSESQSLSLQIRPGYP